MSLIQKPGSAAVECDCPTCHMELLARTKEQAAQRAEEEGWKSLPEGGHLCSDCQAGDCPGAAAAEARYGATSVQVVLARDVAEGEPVYDPTGRVVGRFSAAGKAGTIGEINFVLPPDGKQAVPGVRSCLAGRPRQAGTDVAFPADGWKTSPQGPGTGLN
jgi:hypothetical protein